MPDYVSRPRSPEVQSSFVMSRPDEAIRLLHTVMQDFGKPFELQASQTLVPGNTKESGHILLLTEGWASIFNLNAGLHIESAQGPTIIGLADGYNLYYWNDCITRYYIRAENLCRGFQVSLDIFFRKCESSHLWRDITLIMAQQLLTACMVREDLTGHDAYGAIRSVLAELWQYPQALRFQINASQFIQEKTRLSGSRIIKVLSILRQGGYLTIRDGRLMELKTLPKVL